MEIESDSFPFRRLTDGFTLRGVGLHSGRDCVLTVEPHDGEPVLRHEGAELPLRRLGLAGTGRGSDYVFPDGHRVVGWPCIWPWGRTSPRRTTTAVSTWTSAA